MGVDIDIKIECEECRKTGEEGLFYFHCEDCFMKIIDDAFKDAIIDASTNDYHWKDKEGQCGWETEKEKEIFMRGIKCGFFDALFHIASFRGDEIVREWELIYNKAYEKLN